MALIIDSADVELNPRPGGLPPAGESSLEIV
jgi:hypothetical protein